MFDIDKWHQDYKTRAQVIRIGSSVITEDNLLITPRGNYNLNNRSDLHRLIYDYDQFYECYTKMGLEMRGVVNLNNSIPNITGIEKEKITNKLLLL